MTDFWSPLTVIVVILLVLCLVLFVMLHSTWKSFDVEKRISGERYYRIKRYETELATLKRKIREASEKYGEGGAYRHAQRMMEKACACCGKRCLRCATYIVQTPKGPRRMTFFDELLYREQGDPFISAEDIEGWIEDVLKEQNEGG